MSGGHFNDNGYIYYQVMQFADELESDIRRNAIKDEYGWAHNLNDEAIAYLKSKIAEIRRVAAIMKEIDYLYSGDHAEDSFLESVKKIESE